MIRKYLLLGFLVSLFSCTSSETKNENTEGLSNEWELLILDSIQVDYLGDINLLAVHPEGTHFLFGSSDDNKLILTDNKGEITSIFDEPTDSPKSVGQFTSAATFFGDEIVAMGMNKLVIYDLDFQFIKSEKTPKIGRSMYYIGFDFLKPISINGKEQLLSFNGGPKNEIPSNQPEYYQEYNTFELIDLDENSFTPVVPFHPRSRFLSGEAFDFLRPNFQVDGSTVYFAYTNDSLLYSYDLALGDESFEAINIPFDEFLLNPGYQMKGQMDYETPQDQEGGIWGLFLSQENVLITYNSGIELENMPDLNQEREQVIKEMGRLNPMKWIVMDEKGNFSAPKLTDDKYSLSRTDSQGFLWAKQNKYILESEPEFEVFYKIQLVQK